MTDECLADQGKTPNEKDYEACTRDHVTLEEKVFCNPHVLENVFKFCTAKELSNCRLVTKLWHYVSLPFWKDQAGPIRLYENHRDGVFDKTRHMSLSTFINVYKQSFLRAGMLSATPYKSFKLMFFRNLKQEPISHSISTFWSECGPWIVQLHIIGGRIDDYETYRNVLLSKFTPNLKKLKFSCQCIPGTNERNAPLKIKPIDVQRNLESLSFPYCLPKVEWTDIFTCYPCLNNLELSAPYAIMNWDTEIMKMLDTIANVRQKNPSVLRINDLKLNVSGMILEPPSVLPLRVGNLLQNAQLPLEALSVDGKLFAGPGNQRQLDQIFATYRDTLKRLTIKCGFNDSGLIFPQSKLVSLKELTLVGHCFKNIGILELTPNLKVFHCINPWWPRAPDIVSGDKFLHSYAKIRLLTLNDLRFDYECRPMDIQKLTYVMPNVETLSIPLNNRTFRMVCQHWKGLKQLTVQKNHLDDDGICGDLRLNKAQAFLDAFADHEITQKRQPSIIDLQDLQSFVMNNDNRLENPIETEDIVMTGRALPTKLTEKSFVHGFLNIPRLKTLNVTVAHDTITDQLLTVLKERIGNVNILQMRDPYNATQNQILDML